MKVFLKGVCKLLFVIAYIAVGMKLESDWSDLCHALIGNPVLNTIARLAFFAVSIVVFIFLWSVFFAPAKKNSSPPAQTARPTPAAKPANTHAAKTTTTRSATTQSSKSTTARPAAKATKTVNASPKNIPVDYVKALPGALTGLLSGFALFCVFGLLASLTSGSNITNLFGILGVLCLFGCPLVSFINAVKEQPGQRKLKADEQARAADIEQSLKTALATMNLGCGVTQETFARYAKACDNMVFLCSFYFFDSRYKSIIMPYYNAVHERTWPVYDWRNGKYEHVTGIELAEVLHKEIEKRAQERQEEYERKIRQNTY